MARMGENRRAAAARRRLEGAAPAAGGDPDGMAQPEPGADGLSDLQRAGAIESAIQQAIRRGEFDNLPGAGKPLPGLSDADDPDWWLRRKIESERLHGLGPPALTLRVENAALDDVLDLLPRESDVRETLDDFNRRVIEARRQLLGGPPVVTPTRDVEAELGAWRARRALRQAEEEARRLAEQAARPRRRWWRRRRPGGPAREG